MTPPPSEPTSRVGDDLLDRIPRAPGVYLMKDASQTVIYVGKASNLRARVRSYFRGGDERISVRFLLARVCDIETILTQTDKEAVLLENTLIKKYKPRYNMRLQSDLTYLSLRIDPRALYPRFEITRKRLRDGAVYLGPYDSARSARQTLQFIHRFIPLRQCRDTVMANRTRPCILYDMGRCCAPCCLPVDRDDYARLVADALAMLRGGRDDILRILTEKMQAHSQALEFEKAAELRDKIAAIQRTLQRQRVALAPDFDADGLAHYAESGRICFVVLHYRNGMLDDTRGFIEKDNGLPIEEMYNAFLTQYYDDSKSIPPLVLTQEEPRDVAMLKDYLEDLREGACEIRRPQRGEMTRIVEIGRQNARDRLKKSLSRLETTTEALADLQRKLRLPNPPNRIECYDISTFQGKSTVGARIVFSEGAPDKDAYRRYRIRTVTGTDDFAAMGEVLSRRFRAVVTEEDEAPDLVVLDGGLGQLAVALKVFEDLGISHVPVVALAKSRLQGDVDARRLVRLEAEGATRDEETGDARTAERVFLPGQKNPVLLKRNHPSLYLIQRIRDEAHRFAITYHKKLRSATTVTSALDEIPGVGPARRKALLRHFGSLTALRGATAEQIAQVRGISPTLAEALVAALRPGGPDQEPPQHKDPAGDPDGPKD